MQEILLIRGGSAEQVLDLLAVAAEMSAALGDDKVQIDAAVPAQFADCLALSTALRCVIPVSAPDGEGLSDMLGGEGLGEKLFSPAGLLSAAKKLTSVAGSNIRTYRQFAEDLRATQYDMVFDFEFSIFSIAVSKVAKSIKIIGFDSQQSENKTLSASLSAHETFAISGEMSSSTRMRHLAARALNYTAAAESRALDWCISQCAAPDDAPPPPYLVASAALPPPFMEVIRQTGQEVVVIEEKQPVAEIAGYLQSAAAAVGSGVVAALAAAVGIPNLYVGSEKSLPHRARHATTPKALESALAELAAGGGEEGQEAPAVPEKIQLHKNS